MSGRAIPVAPLGKVVILVEDFGRRGSVRQAYLLARDIRKTHRLNIEVWALSKGELAGAFEAEAIPTRVLGFGRPCCPVGIVRKSEWAFGLARVAIALRRAGARVLLPFGSFPNVVAGISYRMGGVHHCIWGERSGYRVVGERMAATRCRQFVANSGAGVDHLVRRLGVPEDRINFIPNAVGPTEFVCGADWRARLGLSPGQLLVTKVADIGSGRDHATLIRAWRSIQVNWIETPTPLLALVGRFGDSYEECQRMVSQFGLELSVRFLGPLTDPQALIATSDLAIFSSHAEGMPNSVLEYMAAGKPVVASDLPGIRDALGPDSQQVLFPPGDAQRCAQLIMRFLRDASARAAIGEVNRDRARSEFSVEHIVERYLKTMIGKTFDVLVSSRNIAADPLAPAPENV